MFARFRQNPNLRTLLFQEAFFGGFSPWLLAATLVLAVVLPGLWLWIVVAGVVLWVLNLLGQLNSEANYRKAVSYQTKLELEYKRNNAAFNTAELEATLDGLMQSVRGKVKPEIMTKLQTIATTINEILPYSDKVSVNQDTFTVRQTVLEYLPDTLNSYLKLSPRMAEQQVLRDGKTAQAMLGEQLDLLNVSLKDILDSYHRNDTEQLSVQGRFLRDKFQKPNIF